MTFGLTPLGFNAMRLADVKQQQENAFTAQFGEINLDPQSVFGQEIGVLSKALADVWENLNDVYFSQYPNSASGVSLDNVVQFNGITRLPASQTSVVASLDGLEGTSIPTNSLAVIPSTGENFFNVNTGIISTQNADTVIVQVQAVAAQAYSIILSNQTFTYSLPTIAFSNSGAIFVTGNSIIVTLNGIQLSPISFTTNSNTTLAAVATAIAAFATVSSATVVGTTQINIVSELGFSTLVNSIQITGGATQATNVISFRAPANNNAITGNLVGLLNAGTPSWIGVNNSDGTFTITANSSQNPFSCFVAINLSVIFQSSPFTFLSSNFGPVTCPVGALDTIVTPIAGWNGITNTIAGVTGRFIETDAELRIRRANSIRLQGTATVEAIRAQLLQKVEGVTSALVFENRTLTQEPILIVFPAQFNSGDTVTVVYNTLSNFAVAFNTNQATTMANIVSALLSLPQVASASFGGTGNQTITVNMNIFNVLTINSASTDVSAQTAIINGGRPPKSFECVVEGGSDQAVAEQIWLTKPAGIETFGNVNDGDGIVIIDSQGESQVIFFSRPTPIYISVQIAISLYSEETFPVNGLQLVAANINSYGNSLGVGIDVLFQRVLAQIFTVPGIASGNMTIAATSLQTDSPSYGTSDITIQENQISIFDLTRITVTIA